MTRLDVVPVPWIPGDAYPSGTVASVVEVRYAAMTIRSPTECAGTVAVVVPVAVPTREIDIDHPKVMTAQARNDAARIIGW
jgi:hypothetical protein